MGTEKAHKHPMIPVQPMPNTIIVERIEIQSKVEKSLREKNTGLQLTKQQIAQANQEMLEASGDLSQVWDTHPMQGIIMAIDAAASENTKLEVGDRIAWRPYKEVGFYSVFNKKKYVVLYAHDVIWKYLTDKV